jgi:hypothetical protein
MCPEWKCAQHGGTRGHTREGEGTSELPSEALCRKQRGTRLRLTSNRDSLLHPQSRQAHIIVHIHILLALLFSKTCLPLHACLRLLRAVRQHGHKYISVQYPGLRGGRVCSGVPAAKAEPTEHAIVTEDFHIGYTVSNQGLGF